MSKMTALLYFATMIWSNRLQNGSSCKTIHIKPSPGQVSWTAAWLAQLVEHQSAVREVEGSRSRPGLKITKENVLPLQFYLKMVRCIVQIFSDKDYKP